IFQQTRIGRYVNELRKKTKNEQLAKRAKKLVRSWQKLITPSTENVTAVNGTHGERVAPSHPSLAALQGNGSKPNSPALSCKSGSPASTYSPQIINRSSLSKQQMGYRPNTPTLQQTSPALVRSKPNTPKLQQSQVRSRPTTPSLSQYSKQGPSLSPADPKDHSTPKSVSSSVDSLKKVSPETQCAASMSSRDLISNKSRPNTPSVCSESMLEGRLSRNLSQESLNNSISPEARIPCQSHHSKEENSRSSLSPSTQTDSSLNVKTHVASRKRTRDGNQNSSAAPSKRSNSATFENGTVKNVANGALFSLSGEKDTTHKPKISPSDGKQNLPSRRNACLNVSTEKLSEKNMRTPKVKTTAQLIAELQAKSGSSAIGSSVIHQIETNQIAKESDEMPSVLPPGARPKRRRKMSDVSFDQGTPSRPHGNLSQTKTELVEKFLETSITPNTAVDMSPFKYDMPKSESLEKEDTSAEIDVTDSSGGDTSFRPPEVSSTEPVEETAGPSNEETKTKHVTLEELYSQLPPIDYDNVNLEDLEYEMPAAIAVDDERVRNLHEDHVESVNGCMDINGAWRDWTQTLTIASYDGDPLHILPYVPIDD
ncbi:hypothetical protein FSP39_002472, partial [Pinctada imbricata]